MGSTRRRKPAGGQNREGRERTRPQPRQHTATQKTPQHTTTDGGSTHTETPHKLAGRSGTNSNGAANANGRRPTTKPTTQQHSTPHSKAPAQQHSTAQQNTPRRTKQPTPNRGTAQQDAEHRTPPGATTEGGGGGTAPACNAQSDEGLRAGVGKRNPTKQVPRRRAWEKTRQQQQDTGKRAATPAKHKPGGGGGRRDNKRRRQTGQRRRATTRHGGNKRKRGAGPHRPRNANTTGGAARHNRQRAWDTKKPTEWQMTTSGGVR